MRPTSASWIDSCTMSRRSDVQRWPAVPTAENTIARSARSRSADGATISALFPPSSRIVRASRCAAIAATAFPIRVLPVAETTATRASAASAAPASGPPTTSCDNPSGTPPTSAAARSSSDWHASAVSGVFSDGFQTSASPQTSASAEFHDHTAAGKLNALRIATTPAGCQVSIIRCPGRSEAMVRP